MQWKAGIDMKSEMPIIMKVYDEMEPKLSGFEWRCSKFNCNNDNNQAIDVWLNGWNDRKREKVKEQ